MKPVMLTAFGVDWFVVLTTCPRCEGYGQETKAINATLPEHLHGSTEGDCLRCEGMGKRPE